jgi:hypothetical protein
MIQINQNLNIYFIKLHLDTIQERMKEEIN